MSPFLHSGSKIFQPATGLSGGCSYRHNEKTDLEKSVKKKSRLTNTIEFHKLDISKLKKEDYTKINTLIKVYYVEIKELRK